MSEEIRLGGGSYKCDKCGVTTFGSVEHKCPPTPEQEIIECATDPYHSCLYCSKCDDDMKCEEHNERVYTTDTCDLFDVRLQKEEE